MILRVVSPARWLTSILSTSTFLPFGVKIIGIMLLFLRIWQLSMVRRFGAGSAVGSLAAAITIACCRQGYAAVVLGLARLRWGTMASSCKVVMVARLGICLPMYSVALPAPLCARWLLKFADPGTPL